MTKQEFAGFVQKFLLPDPEFEVWTLAFGERKSKQIGEGIEFKEFRPYEPGEDIANLDPEATIREGEPTVRENLTEEQVQYAVILDDSLSLRYYGMREVALIAVGCYLFSATALREPSRVLVLNGDSVPFISPQIFSLDDALALLFEIWDMLPKRAAASSLEECSNAAARILSLDNTRVLFVSDFLFRDCRAVFDRRSKKIVFDGRDVLRRAVGSTYAGGASSTELAFLGVSPDWDVFRKALRGYYRTVDAEDGSRSLRHFTRRKANRYVEKMLAREKAWKNATRSLGVPMGWIHAGSPETVSRKLERAFGV